MKLYMFRTVPLSIFRSFSLYTQQWYVIQICKQPLTRSKCSCSQAVCTQKRVHISPPIPDFEACYTRLWGKVKFIKNAYVILAEIVYQTRRTVISKPT